MSLFLLQLSIFNLIITMTKFTLKHFFNYFFSFRPCERRRNYWQFVIVWLIVDGVIFWGSNAMSSINITVSGLLLLLFAILIIPFLAATARRLHDVGFGAWWLLLLILPVCVVIIIIMCLLPGKHTDSNKYYVRAGKQLLLN